MQNVQLTGDFLILLILLVPVCLLERHWWSLYPFCIFNTIIVHIGYIFVENGRNVLCLCFYIQFVWSWKINKYNINEVHIDSYAFYMFHILEQIYEKILLLCVLIIKGTLPSDAGKLLVWSFSSCSYAAVGMCTAEWEWVKHCVSPPETFEKLKGGVPRGMVLRTYSM